MSKLSTFYDRYHKKNRHYSKIIRPGNFTYWYTLDFLHQACPEGFEGKKILDVGCGVGAITLYLAQLGAKAKGIDVSKRAIKIATQAKKETRLKNVWFGLGEVKSEPRAYDVITCFEVIEHVADDLQLLQTFYKNLKSGGTLVLSTPTDDNVLFRLGFYKKFDEEVGHLRRYRQEKLTKLLKRAGFKVNQVRQVEGPLRNILFTTQLGILIKGIKGPLIPIFHWIDQLTGSWFGFSDIQVIARKS